MPAKSLSRVSRTWDERGMDPTCSRLGTNADPSKRRVLKSRFGVLSTGVDPGWSPSPAFGVKRREGFPAADSGGGVR